MYRNIKICSVLLLSFYLIFMPVAHAVYDPNARNGKWYVDRLMADPTLKATVEIKAQRNYPVSTLGADGKPIVQSKVQKSTIKLAPKAANVGKSIFKRTPVGAITQALIGLGISATDWVLDPENNRVKYKDPNNPTGGTGGDYYFVVDGAVYDQHDKACQAVYDKAYPNENPKRYMAVSWVGTHNDICRFLNLNTGTYTTLNGYSVRRLQNPFVPGDPADAGYQYIPIDQLASKVIEQANAGDPAAMEVMSDTALDMLEQGLLDDQLAAAADPKVFNDGESDPIDPNAPAPAPDPDTPTEPSSDAKPFELPPFCSWASKVCEWADWTMEDAEPPPDTPLPEKDVQMTDPSAFDKSYVSVEEECPADINASIPVGPTSFSLVIPITPICYFGSTYVSPVLQFMAYIFVALGISRSLRVG